jgi:hypothetical protein
MSSPHERDQSGGPCVDKMKSGSDSKGNRNSSPPPDAKRSLDDDPVPRNELGGVLGEYSNSASCVFFRSINSIRS